MNKDKSQNADFYRPFKSLKSVYLLCSLSFVVLASLLVFSSLNIKKLSTEYNIEQFFPPKHPLLKQSAKIRQTFQLNERPTFLVVIENNEQNWLEKRQLSKLTTITEKIKNLKETRSIISIANLEGAITLQKNLNIGRIYENIPPHQWAAFTQKNELIRSQLISPDYKSVLLLVEPNKLSTNQLTEFSEKIRTTVAKVAPQTNVEIGGVPAIQSQLSAKLFKELKLFLILSILGFCAVFFLFFRGFSAVVITLIALVSSNTAVIGTLAYFGIPFSVLLTTLPIVVSIALVSVNIHSLHRWAEFNKQDLNALARFNLSLSVLKEMFLANLLGSLTTSLGFLTLCTTEIPLIKEYGWVVASSVMLAWVTTHLILLCFMHLINPVLRDWTQQKALWGLPILKNARWILASILISTLVFALYGKNVTFSARLFDDLPRQDSSRRATEDIDQDFGGVVPYELVLQAKTEGFWLEPKNLHKIQKLSEQIRHAPQVGSLITVTDFFENQKVPTSKQAISEFLFLFSMAENNPLKNYITENGRNLRLAIRMHDLPTKDIEYSRYHIKKLINFHVNSVQILEAGLAVNSHTINKEVSKNLVFNFWHSILLVGFILCFVFKSVRWAAVACLPNLIPPAILIGSLAITQTPIKPGVGLIFSIALGLAFNNTVYLLTRLKRNIQEKDLSYLPIKKTLLQEGNPCLFETLVMFAGFVIFLASDFKLNQIFGVYMVLSILAGALGDLVFLPVVLKLFPGLLLSKKSTKTKQNETPYNEAPQFDHKVAASFILFICLGIMGATAKAQSDNPSELLKKVQAQITAKDEQSTVKMKIIEANGEVKNRTIKIQSLKKDKFYVTARIETPADIKGTAVLAQIDKNHEEQWIYLPSSKQVRRIVGNKKSSGVLGSELTAEDLNSDAIKSSKNKLIKKDNKQFVIELTPSQGSSIYSKALMSFSLPDYLPKQTQYFKGSKIVKTVVFSKYTKVNNIYRAQLVQIKNLANKRGTDLEISNIKLNTGLSPDDFTVNSLKSE